MSNRLTLINNLSGVVLDGQFKNITIVNCDPVTGNSKADNGMLSLVFRAEDIDSGAFVAIKFFDPDWFDPTNLRQNLFIRESELLLKLRNKNRCLQLTQEVRQYPLIVTNAINGQTLTLNTLYMIMEWIEDDILDYFLNQDQFDAITKLKVFRLTALSIFSLHAERIYHRDVKRDNFRKAIRNNSEYVIAIDLGTAVSIDAQPNSNQSIYANPLGAGAFAPLEAHCGLGGIRKLGVSGDVYALGSMLHDLFNIDLFHVRLFNEVKFLKIFAAFKGQMLIEMQKNPSEEDILKIWHKNLKLIQHESFPLSIEGSGNTIPNAIKNNLNQLFNDLINLDYRKRLVKSDVFLHKIDGIIRILSSAKLEEKRIQERLKLKQQKEQRAKLIQDRLDEYLNRQQG